MVAKVCKLLSVRRSVADVLSIVKQRPIGSRQVNQASVVALAAQGWEYVDLGDSQAATVRRAARDVASHRALYRMEG